MKDHKDDCWIVKGMPCTCDTDDKVQAIFWQAKHHRQKVISYILGFWFALAALFNVLFVLHAWIWK